MFQFAQDNEIQEEQNQKQSTHTLDLINATSLTQTQSQPQTLFQFAQDNEIQEEQNQKQSTPALNVINTTTLTQTQSQPQTFENKLSYQFQNDAMQQQQANKQTAMHLLSVPQKYNAVISPPDISQKQLNNLGLNNNAWQQSFINYADDEPLNIQEVSKEQEAQLLEMAKAREYDIEKGIHLCASTLYKHYFLSSTEKTVIQAQISISADSQRQIHQQQNESAMEDEQQKKKSRQQMERDGIDLICVLDTSGSMEGEKLKYLKRTLSYLITLMNDRDRLCLISFSQIAVRLNALRCMTSAYKDELESKVINKLDADGGTCINEGMKMSMEVLNQRRHKNKVSSVFLLSDGLDDNAEMRVKESLLSSQLDETVTIHCFGFGADHDAKMMREIAKLRNGNFYFIHKLDMLDEYFVDAFGGLVSIVAQNVTLKIALCDEKLQFHPQKALFQNASISKVFGNNVKYAGNGQFQIGLQNIFEGVSKDFVLEVSVPQTGQPMIELQDHEKNIPLLEIALTAESPDKKQHIAKSTVLLLTCNNQKKSGEQDDEFEQINENVLQNVFRVRGAEAIEDAMKCAESNQHQKGQELLEKEMQQINRFPMLLQSCGVLKLLLEDLQQAHKSCAKQAYAQVGKSFMASIQHSHSNQMNVPSPIQKQMSQCLQIHKSHQQI